MREILLAAESGAAAGLSGWDLALHYIIYGAVIVLSIVILILIRKRTRLPRHAEIKARLDKLLEQAQSLSGPAESRMDFISASPARCTSPTTSPTSPRSCPQRSVIPT